MSKKKRDWNQAQEQRMKRINSKSEAWKYIRKMGGKRGSNKEEIERKMWKEHFKKELGGEEIANNTVKEIRKENNDGIEIKEWEIDEMIRKMKLRKAVGLDGLGNEVWVHGGSKMKEILKVLIEKIGSTCEIPEGWKRGKLVPIWKGKGDKKDIKRYRGVVVMDTLCRAFAGIIERKLTEEIETKNLLSETQFGFRTGRGAMECVYIVNWLMNRKRRERDKGLCMCFMDMKSAFDKVEREKLWRMMEKREVSENLRRMIEALYEKVEMEIWVDGRGEGAFKTKRGLRQGCPLSGILFNIYMSDLEQWLAGRQVGGIKIGNMIIRSLSFADDIIMLADSKENMRRMMKEMEKYMERKGMEINVEKTMVMVGKGSKWEGKVEIGWRGRK